MCVRGALGEWERGRSVFILMASGGKKGGLEIQLLSVLKLKLGFVIFTHVGII